MLPVLRSSRLPLSYLTNGQNVPDDIEIGRCPPAGDGSILGSWNRSATKQST